MKRETFQQLLIDFFTRFIQSFDFDRITDFPCSFFGMFPFELHYFYMILGIKYLSMERSLYLSLVSFIYRLKASVNMIDNIVVLFQSKVIWSDLPVEVTRWLFHSFAKPPRHEVS